MRDFHKISLAGLAGLALPFVQHLQLNGHALGPVINAVVGAAAMVVALFTQAPEKK